MIPIGVYDGYRRPLKDKDAFVLIKGKRAPVINVTLEYTTLDITRVEVPDIGDEVVLVGASGGERIWIQELADWQGAGPSDVLMSIHGRFLCICQ